MNTKSTLECFAILLAAHVIVQLGSWLWDGRTFVPAAASVLWFQATGYMVAVAVLNSDRLIKTVVIAALILAIAALR